MASCFDCEILGRPARDLNPRNFLIRSMSFIRSCRFQWWF